MESHNLLYLVIIILASYVQCKCLDDANSLALMERLKSVEQELAETKIYRDPPIYFQCAFQDMSRAVNSAITFDELTFSKTNDWTAEGGIDISTGVLNAPFPGTYFITYSLMSSDHDTDPETIIHMKLNGDVMDGYTYYRSLFESNDYGIVHDQGGRSLILHLDRGDTVELFCDHCGSSIFDILLCVQLSQFDV